MATRTLADLEADIRYRYDLAGFTARHPQADIFRLINDAYRTFRDRLTTDGCRLFTVASEATVTTIGRTAHYPGTILPAASFASFATVDEVHCKYGSSWRPLRHIQFAAALNWTDLSQSAPPQAWCLATQSIDVLVVPSLDSARQFRIVGLPPWTTLTSGTDTIPIDLGAQEFIWAYVGAVVGARDDDVNAIGVRMQAVDLVYADLRRRFKAREPSARRVNVRGEVRRGWA
jgi:hypothetical protein